MSIKSNVAHAKSEIEELRRLNNIITDENGEEWLYCGAEGRVFHSGAEIEMAESGTLFFEGCNQNGEYFIDSFEEAIQWVRENYGIMGEAE